MIGPGESIVLAEDFRASRIMKPNSRSLSARAADTFPREDLAGACFRLHDHQRCQRARFSDGHDAMDDGQDFRHFRAHGAGIVSADEIADPHALDISLTINGEVLQHSNTRELIFKIPELVAFLSSVFTLEPGDVVSTGTPAGVGLRASRRVSAPATMWW